MGSFKDIIDAIGAQRLAEAFKVTESHVRVMRARNSIPPLYWPDLIALAPHDGEHPLTFDDLKRFREAMRPESGDAA
jgi:hypothetical protein